jgi:hypothetical protein
MPQWQVLGTGVKGQQLLLCAHIMQSMHQLQICQYIYSLGGLTICLFAA